MWVKRHMARAPGHLRAARGQGDQSRCASPGLIHYSVLSDVIAPEARDVQNGPAHFHLVRMPPWFCHRFRAEAFLLTKTKCRDRVLVVMGDEDGLTVRSSWVVSARGQVCPTPSSLNFRYLAKRLTFRCIDEGLYRKLPAHKNPNGAVLLASPKGEETQFAALNSACGREDAVPRIGAERAQHAIGGTDKYEL